MDGFGKRAQLLAVYESELESAAHNRKRNVEGQIGLFGMEQHAARAIPLPDVPEFELMELLRLEKETCGLYFSGHPMDQYADEVKKCRAVPLARLLSDAEENIGEFKDNQEVTVAGLVAHVSNRITRNNTMMAHVTLEDTTAAMELLAFSNVLKRDGGYLTAGTVICAKGKYSTREDKEPQIVLDEARPLARFSEIARPPGNTESAGDGVSPVRRLCLKVPGDRQELSARVLAMVSFFPGTTPVMILEEASGKRLSGLCNPENLLTERLRMVLGEDNVVEQV
jgi:DNA polymerase-3 subunit alpha